MTQGFDESGWPDESEEALPRKPDMTMRDSAEFELPEARGAVESSPPALAGMTVSDDLLLESDGVPPRKPDSTLRDSAEFVLAKAGGKVESPSPPTPVEGLTVSEELLLESELPDPQIAESETETVEDSEGDDDDGPPPRLVDVIRGGPTEAYRAAGSTLGPYVVEAEVARGGMGAVYRAHHESLAERRVALKVLLAGAGATAKQRQRFLREATVGAKLLHPGIVRVHDYGEESGVPWLALEFVEGPTLLARMGELTVRALVELLAKAARALEVAHEAGVVHRDLKPANIMIRPGGEPALTDFGLARDLSAHSSITKDGTALGTPFYMAPEQTRGKTPSPATDVFALGVLLYQGLTGSLPFEGETVADLYGAINNREPEAPSKRSPERAPPLLDHVVRRALQKDPEERYPHAGKLARDLEHFLEGTLRPPPVDVRVPLLVLGAMIALLLGLLAADRLRSTSTTAPPGPSDPVAAGTSPGPAPLPWEPPRLPRAVDPLPTQAAAGVGAVALVERAGWAVGSGMSIAEATAQVKVLAARRLAPVALQVNPSTRRPRLSIVWGRLQEGETATTQFGLLASDLQRAYAARSSAHLVALAVAGAYPHERYAATWIEGRAGQGSPRPTLALRIEPARWREVSATHKGRLITVCATAGRHARLAGLWWDDGQNATALIGASRASWSAELVLRSNRSQRLIGSARWRQHARAHYAGVWLEDRRGSLTFADRTASEQQLIAQVVGGFGYQPVWMAETGTKGRTLSVWVRSADRRWRGSGPDAAPGFAAIEADLRAFMERHDVGAAALAITRGGRLVHARGYGYGPGDQVPIGPRARFRIGQAVEPLLATAALRLVDDGRLKLDQTLGELFPVLRRPGPQQATDPRLAGVSVRRLLRHRAGWERYRIPNRFHPSLGYPLVDPTFGFDREVLATLSANGPLTSEQVFRYAIKQPLEHAPGSSHHEVALSYVFLGRVLERVGGRDLQAVFKKEVLAPLSASDFAPAGSSLATRLEGEVVYQGGRLAVPMSGRASRIGPKQYGGFTLAAADGWATSAVDLARFVSSFSGRALVSEQAAKESWRAGADAAYGMGWHVDGETVWSTGSLPGSFAHLRRTADGTGIVLLLNADVPGLEVIDRIGTHLSRLAPQDWPKRDLFR